MTLFMSVGLSPLTESYCSLVGVYSVRKNKFNSTVCYACVYLPTKEELFSKIRVYMRQKRRLSAVINVYFKYFVRTAVTPVTWWYSKQIDLILYDFFMVI